MTSCHTDVAGSPEGGGAARRGLEQGGGVLVPGRREHLRGGALLHDEALLHYGDAVQVWTATRRCG